MTFSTETGAVPSQRKPWLRIAAASGLLLIGVATTINSVGLTRLSEQTHTSAQASQVEILANRLAALEGQAAQDQRRPAPVSQTSFDSALRGMQDRLSALEQAKASAVGADEVQALRTEIQTIASRVDKLGSARPQAPTHHRAAPPAKLKPTEPPFAAVGVELRGGERFLAVAPNGISAASQVRLLRVGDTEAGWRLESMDATGAVFRVDGQTQRLAVP